MRRSTLDELARAPVGRFVAGETFVHFCAAPTLWGVILWGRPDGGHALELGRSLVLELAPPAVPHPSIVDASRLDGGDPAAVGAAGRYLTPHPGAPASVLRRPGPGRPPRVGGPVGPG